MIINIFFKHTLPYHALIRKQGAREILITVLGQTNSVLFYTNLESFLNLAHIQDNWLCFPFLYSAFL